MRHVQDAVFEICTSSAFLVKRIEGYADLALARSTDLMVMHVDGQAHVLHGGAHSSSNVVQGVYRWHGEVAAFDARTVAHVAIFKVWLEAPRRFFRVDVYMAPLMSDCHLTSSKTKNSGSGPKIGCVTDTGGSQIRLSPLCERAWVAVVALHGARLDDVAAHVDEWSHQ